MKARAKTTHESNYILSTVSSSGFICKTPQTVSVVLVNDKRNKPRINVVKTGDSKHMQRELAARTRLDIQCEVNCRHLLDGELIEEGFTLDSAIYTTPAVLMPHGLDILEWRTANLTSFTEDLIYNVADAVLRALDYMHSRFVYHRDIKPDNIFFVSTQGATLTSGLLPTELLMEKLSKGHILIKLGDFDGCAYEFDEDGRCLDVEGTATYSPPEVNDCSPGFNRLVTNQGLGPSVKVHDVDKTLYGDILREVAYVEFGRKAILPFTRPEDPASMWVTWKGKQYCVANTPIPTRFLPAPVDMWMVGSTLYTLCAEKMMETKVIDTITLRNLKKTDADPFELIPNTTTLMAELKSLVEQLLVPAPEHRLSLKKSLNAIQAMANCQTYVMRPA